MNPFRWFWGYFSGRAYFKDPSPKRRFLGELTAQILIFGLLAAFFLLLYLLRHH